MKIKVVDTPDSLFEYTAEVPPRKGEFISYKDRGYTVSYVSHHIDEVPDTGDLEEIYAVVEVSTSQTFLGQELKSY